MDEIDKRILNLIQKDFPIKPEPFKELAENLKTSEAEVLSRVSKLKEEGIIRRIGASFDSNKLGYVSTLCAVKVPKNKMEQTVKVINGYLEVTHNYLREHEFNIWFTLIAESQAKIDTIIEEISEKTGGLEIINLPAINLFKINVNFNINGV